MATTLGETIRTILMADSTVAGLIGGRIYPNFAPQGSLLPHMVYFTISAIPENDFTGTSQSRLITSRLQVDSYSKSYIEAHAVADAIEAVLANLASPDLSCERVDGRDLYDNETQLHRASVDYSVSS